MERYFSSRRLRSLSVLSLRSWPRWRCRASPSAAAAASGSEWAPPGGSGTISSITPRFRRSCAVIFRASAARSRWLASFHRIAAHPSGGITEYTEVSRLSTPSARAAARADGERAARAAFADHRGDDRRLQRRHLDQAARDRLGLAALFGAEAGVGARRVDQGDHGRAEFRRQPHEPHRLAVALRMRHPEVAIQVFLGVAALLMSDDHDGDAVEPRPAADDGGVVAVQAVAVQLHEIGEYGVDVVERIGPARMPGD